MSLHAHPLVRDWLRVSDGRLILRTGKVDVGQRISTALIRIAAEELSLPVDCIDIAPVRTGDSPDEGITSGSNSIQQSGHAQRLACATARAAALARVAAEWRANIDDLQLEEGIISHGDSNDRRELVALIADLPHDLPVDADAPARILAEPLPDMTPRGLQEMVEGRFTYLHDLERPGMLHARLVRPPVLNARLETINTDTCARLTEAGLHIIRDGAFLAVAGPGEWQVVRAAETLANACTWDPGKGLDAQEVFESLREKRAQQIAVPDGRPDPSADVPARLQSPDFEAVYERPYTLHGALAPSAAMAEYTAGKLEVLTHSQGLYSLRDSIADSLGLAVTKVVLEHVPGSGCYGHNGADDAAFEAALVARALPDTPILLKYSRGDEHGREPVGTAMAVSVQTALNQVGQVEAIWMEARGDSFRGRPRTGPNRAGPARLAANMARDCDVPRFVPELNMNRHAGLHRNLDPIYDFADKRMVKALVTDLPLRPSALRCLGAPANILAIESTMDSLARRADADPIAYRIAHLQDDRAIAVLSILGDMLAAAPVLREGAGRGVAFAQYKNAMTRVAVAVDVRVDELGAVRLDHVHLVADAGRVVDPDGLRAQLEGGVLQGASWALHEKVVWGPKGRESLDWDSYPTLRFDNVPRFDIRLTGPQTAPSAGAGEASPGPTVAAIANAIFDATGLRLRRMPFDADAVMQAALQA